ncbi:MAG: hypothetical protein V4671_10320 [Armatimonadota bacterium]
MMKSGITAAAGLGILLLTGGCGPKGGDDGRSANAPPVKVNAPVPANAPPAAAASIQASQAQGAAMASKAAADGDAYKKAREQSGQ